MLSSIWTKEFKSKQRNVNECTGADALEKLANIPSRANVLQFQSFNLCKMVYLPSNKAALAPKCRPSPKAFINIINNFLLLFFLADNITN